MKKIIGLFGLVAIILLNACGTVSLTGRKQMLLVSDTEVLSSSLTQYSEFMKDAKLSTNAKGTAMVVRVGKNIAAATEAYLKSVGLESEIKNFSWEFHLVQSADVNAFCMPGGKIVVYDGILPYTSSDEELAAVLGHEVAHAVAKHSNERMSQQILAAYGGAILEQAVNGRSSVTKELAGTVYGLGAQYAVMLPFSRKHELEADHMGLIFMAMAGYKPEAAITFWEKMAQAGGAGIPEFMSTHPNDSHRVQEIKKNLPEAMTYYKKPAASK
jgi:predicted Zn-dependent protease